MAKKEDVVMPETRKSFLTFKITADTTEFEEAIDKCIEKAEELAQFIERIGTRTEQAIEIFTQFEKQVDKLSNVDIKD